MVLELSQIDRPDDPDKPEFGSLFQFSRFAGSVERTRRYAWTEEIEAFLATVRRTAPDRESRIAAGRQFYRAQEGTCGEPDLQEDGTLGDVAPFGPSRMKLRRDRAKERRANATGIPVLYMAGEIETAVAEMRAGQGARLSVAELEAVRDLRALDLTHSGGMWMPSPTLAELNKPENKERAVWSHIDNAFSRPVQQHDDTAEYASTQILAEVFRNAGYDALVYGSQFGVEGTNVVLFDPEDAVVVAVTAYKVLEVITMFGTIGETRRHRA